MLSWCDGNGLYMLKYYKKIHEIGMEHVQCAHQIYKFDLSDIWLLLLFN